MLAYKIERNVPLPTIRPGTVLEVLAALKGGESVFFERQHQDRIMPAMQKAKKLGGHFVSRAEGDGRRVWCVDPMKKTFPKKRDKDLHQ